MAFFVLLLPSPLTFDPRHLVAGTALFMVSGKAVSISFLYAQDHLQHHSIITALTRGHVVEFFFPLGRC